LQRFARALGVLSLLVMAGCGAADAKVDLGDMVDTGVVVCDGQTLDELEHAKTVSDACKAELAAYLPAPSNDFSGHLALLGEESHDDGSLRVFVAGVDASGQALSNGAFAAAAIATRTQTGPFVSSGDSLVVTPFASLSEAALSLELVNDYSATMSISDLDVVQRIEDDLLTRFSPIYEGEVTLFSSDVRVKQAFTTDSSDLLAAVECDEAFDRELTALYDGMGNGLDSLVSRTRPARVLLVSTDGLENASVAYKKADIVKEVAENHVFVVMLGALFADTTELESLAGAYGVYFYTPLYANLRDQVKNLVTALTHGVAIDIPADLAAAGPLELTVAGETVDLD
jgi:von Willebrand factor type A domain